MIPALWANVHFWQRGPDSIHEAIAVGSQHLPGKSPRVGVRQSDMGIVEWIDAERVFNSEAGARDGLARAIEAEADEMRERAVRIRTGELLVAK